MSKKTFNPSEWRDSIKSESPISSKSPKSSISPNAQFDLTEDVEELTRAIESAGIDITSGYDNWLDLGFALADGLGEGGRSFFHRISRFYPNYNETDADKQFTACLNGKREGITIRTLFYIAQQHNITISRHRDDVPSILEGDIGEMEDLEEFDRPAEPLPTFSQDVGNLLPELLYDVVRIADSVDDADMLILGSIAFISACLPNITGIYHKCEVCPNLYLFVEALASAGKGRLLLCYHIVQPIDDDLQRQSEQAMDEYRRQLKDYELDKKNNEEPQKPPVKMLKIPGNSSATAVYQHLNDNGGYGLIFETEADALSGVFKSDFGNYSYGLRCAFQHEPITYSRRTEGEYVNVKKPHLSVIISGTHRQNLTLMNDSENGLFSRFLFDIRNFNLDWINVFEQSDEPLEEYFDNLGLRFYEFYKKLIDYNQTIRVCLTKSQQDSFNEYFKQAQSDYYYMFGEHIVASVRRLGLIMFRIIMILTALRYMDKNELSPIMTCSDTDFNIALTMIKVLFKHTEQVYKEMPTIDSGIPNNGLTVICQTFYDKLPNKFDRKTYLTVASKLAIPFKTAEKYINRFIAKGMLSRFSHGSYNKL